MARSIYRFIFDTFGWLAIALLIICSVSGVILVIPYDVNRALASVTQMATYNVAAALFRNIHYWSAQLFLMTTLAHIIEFLLKNRLQITRQKGLWLRLVISVAFVFYAMLSGFILKADADSLQAQLILINLLQGVPLVGEPLSALFAGKGGDLQVIYIQHVGLATIFTFIVTFEHVRSLKVKWETLLATLSVVILLSVFLRAPISLGVPTVMKGPWYFIGLQELMHWLANPVWVLLPLLLFLIALYSIPYTKSKFAPGYVVAFSAVYVLATLAGTFFRGESWRWQWPFAPEYQPTELFQLNRLYSGSETGRISYIGEKAEGCMACHATMTGFSPSHDPAVIGCVSCHGGDPYTTNKGDAHRKMFASPGELTNAVQACGAEGCHPAIVPRVKGSIMNTITGMISVNRWVFGEQSTPDGAATVKDIRFSAADTHLRNLCAGCHLGSVKPEKGPAAFLDRGGGCLACHLNYDAASLAELEHRKKDRSIDPKYHPSLNIQIGNDKCLSCHSRSGRISMNYEGWHETDRRGAGYADSANYRLLPDGRVFTKMPADVHHEAGMLCIDCHGSYEVMGDGTHYLHKEEAVKILCEDCHNSGKPKTKQIRTLDQESRYIASLRNYGEQNRVVLTEKESRPIINAMLNFQTDKPELTGKGTGRKHEMKAPADDCLAPAHSRLSCESCHSAWVPQCIGCHNTYEPRGKGYDMLKRKYIKGTWEEYSVEGFADLPVLGVNEHENKIKTFTPGMILTIDKRSFGSKHTDVAKRLYAPASAHTTRKESRSCKSCHNDPLALGFGRGTLKLAEGLWEFSPEYENLADGLPADAWTGFGLNRNDAASTRKRMRPFNAEEQAKILNVGACLTCHTDDSEIMRRSLYNFQAVKEAMSPLCKTGRGK